MNVNSWQRFLEGDEESFSELYRYYFSELFAYGTRIGFNEEVCKDAIQDVFYKLFISKAQLTHIQNIEFYLIQSVRNRLYDLHNAETKIIRVNYDEVFQEHENSVIEEIIKQEKESTLRHQLENSLKLLPPKQRKIIHYRYQLNLSYQEIALLTNMGPEAVKKSLYRALKKLKEHSPDMMRHHLFIILLSLG
jgi:RNA polymerase sigma factor (sigma-70 family)